jgi:NADH:ubiquinone oxidoreductase subunit 2 (subunit N)
MRWTAAVILRPVTFVLAIVAAVLTGNRSDSFWYGLLAFFIAIGAGRVLGALIRGRTQRALYKAVWPAAATGYAFLFSALGLPPWATFFVSVIAASLTKSAVPAPTRLWQVRRIDLDELLP